LLLEDLVDLDFGLTIGSSFYASTVLPSISYAYSFATCWNTLIFDFFCFFTLFEIFDKFEAKLELVTHEPYRCFTFIDFLMPLTFPDMIDLAEGNPKAKDVFPETFDTFITARYIFVISSI